MDKIGFRVSIIVAVVCVVLLLIAGTEDSSLLGKRAVPPITIVFSHVVGQNTPNGVGALMFKRLVKERLAEKVAVQVYPNALLYRDGFRGEKDHRDKVMDALKAGKVHLAAPSFSQLSDKYPALKIFDLPVLFENGEEVDKFYQENQKFLVASLEKEGYLVLAHWQGGMKQLSAKKSLKVPGDVRDLTFHIQQSEVLKTQFEVLGAKVPEKTVGFDEVYKALERGKIDGQENTWSNIYSEKYFEIGNQYFSETNHGYLGYLLITNNAFWNGLPNDVRTELEGILREVTEEVNGQEKEARQKFEQELKEARQKPEQELKEKNIVTVELEKWCEAIWDNQNREKWKPIITEIGAELLNAAKAVSKDPGRCPFRQIDGLLKN